MISFSEAKELVLSKARSFGTEKLHLDDAIGRVICQPVVADRDYPPFNRSAMDGYAIRFEDWINGQASYKIKEVIFAGQLAVTEIRNGECYKIMTGAGVPGVADTVIRKEDVTEDSGIIHCVSDTVTRFQNIASRGGDLVKGQNVLIPPMFCTPGVMGVLASVGQEYVQVETLPSISIITTGNEIVMLGEQVNPVQIRNSNRHVLRGFLKGLRTAQSGDTHVPDDVGKIREAIMSAKKSDIVILSGAVSAGDADFVPDILEELGATKVFHKVAIRPGKPLWFGYFDNGPVIFGLPGNPLSCIVTYKIFIEPFIFRCFGISAPTILAMPLNETRVKHTLLDEFFPVRIMHNPSCFEKIRFNGSGDITAAMYADAIARHPADIANLPNGTFVEGYPLFRS